MARYLFGGRCPPYDFPYYVLVHPTKRVAKVYRLTEEGRYVKAGDFTDETFRFPLKDCAFDFDFSKIWRR